MIGNHLRSNLKSNLLESIEMEIKVEHKRYPWFHSLRGVIGQMSWEEVKISNQVLELEQGFLLQGSQVSMKTNSRGDEAPNMIKKVSEDNSSMKPKLAWIISDL